MVVLPFRRSFEPGETQRWYAVQVTPKLTAPAVSALRQKGFEAFTPFRTVVRKWCDRTSLKETPAFPGYVFARMDIRSRLAVLTTPGVRGIVGFGRRAAPVCDEEIEAIQRVMSSRLSAEPWPFFSPGDPVRVVGGPLAGISGVLVSVKKGNRVVVRVTLIEQALAVDVDTSWVRLGKA